jgi:hypothetical protein
MSQCTWVDCNNEATAPQVGKDGNQWANLCEEHTKEMDDNLMDAKGVLRCWVRAQGGAQGMVGKMRASGEIDRMARFMHRLSKKVKR